MACTKGPISGSGRNVDNFICLKRCFKPDKCSHKQLIDYPNWLSPASPKSRSCHGRIKSSFLKIVQAFFNLSYMQYIFGILAQPSFSALRILTNNRCLNATWVLVLGGLGPHGQGVYGPRGFFLPPFPGGLLGHANERQFRPGFLNPELNRDRSVKPDTTPSRFMVSREISLLLWEARLMTACEGKPYRTHAGQNKSLLHRLLEFVLFGQRIRD